MANRVGRALVEFVVIAKRVFIMGLKQRALLSLSLLVKVAVRYGHITRVKFLQRSAANACRVRDLSFVGVQCLHLS